MLHEAAESGHAECVSVLVSSGENINAADRVSFICLV